MSSLFSNPVANFAFPPLSPSSLTNQKSICLSPPVPSPVSPWWYRQRFLITGGSFQSCDRLELLKGVPFPCPRPQFPQNNAHSAMYVILLSGKVGAKWESSSSVGFVTSYQVVVFMLWTWLLKPLSLSWTVSISISSFWLFAFLARILQLLGSCI